MATGAHALFHLLLDYPPEGEQTLYHTHSLDYPYVLVTSVTLFNQIYGQEPQDVKMQAGFIGYYNAAVKGAYTHRFINRGPGAFRAIASGLLGADDAGLRGFVEAVVVRFVEATKPIHSLQSNSKALDQSDGLGGCRHPSGWSHGL